MNTFKYKYIHIYIIKEYFLKISLFGDFNMSMKDGEIVMPGDKLGIIEQYLPGYGTYDDEGDIKSAVLGNVKINQKKKIISVK